MKCARLPSLLIPLRLCLGLFLLASGATCPTSAEAEKPIIIRNTDPPRPDQSVIYHYEEGVAVGVHGVEVLYEDAVLTAETVRLNERTGEIVAEGDVTLRRGDQLFSGDRLLYNFRTEEMEAEDFRAGAAPFFVWAEQMATIGTNQTYSATNAFVTTDDVKRPFYRIRARSIRFTPGEEIEAHGATLYVGNVPVMYFPFYRKRLDRHPNNFVLTPGYRSRFGPYLLTTYNWVWDEHLQGWVQLDYRLKRGLGAGPGLDFDLGRWGTGEASAYYLNDDKPGETHSGEPIDDDRYRLQFSYEATLRTNLFVAAVADKQSDPLVTRDFFESQYRENPQPKSFLELRQTWPNYSLNLLAQPQFNNFFQTVERLPDITLTAFRQQLGVSPFFYEAENSAGYYRFEPGAVVLTNSFAAIRADSFHQLLLPKTFFGWLNVTPRVGGRLTYYGEAHGSGATTDEETRGVFNTGTEVSFKASRVWPGASSRLWEIDGLRHIVQPSVNYSFVPSPTTSPRHLPQFDPEIPTYRLLPIEYPDYRAIDAIDSQNVLRLSLRNKVQTRREGEIDNLLNWAFYTDWRLDPRPGQHTFADFFSDADLKPWSWLVINSEVRYDLDDSRFDLANHSFTLSPGNVWSWQFGHRYFRGGPEFGPRSENNLFFSSIYYRLNENWGFRISHHFEARDGVLEEQYYTLYRDLRSWTAALTFRIRDHRDEEVDYAVAITFSLKAFPRFRLGRDRHDPSFLLGG